LRDLPDLREEVGRIIRDVRAGRIQLDQPWPRYPTRRTAKPDLSTLMPLATFEEPGAARFQARDGVTAEIGPGPDGPPWLHTRFAQYAPGKPEWPGVLLSLDSQTHQGAAATAGWLVAKVHNYLPTDSEVGLTVRDSRGNPFWARYFPLPAQQTTDVCAPLTEIRRMVDLSDVAGMTVLMRRPPMPTHLALKGLYLAPMQFEAVQGATCACPRVSTPPVVDGNPSDACWAQATPIALEDEHLAAPPLRPVFLRAVSSGSRLYLHVGSQLGTPPDLVASADPNARWLITDDTVECVLRNQRTGNFLKLVVNSKGRTSAHVVSADGRRVAAQPQIASVVGSGAWRLEMAIDLAPLGGDGPPFGLQVRRQDTQIGSLVWPRDLALTEGVEAIALLRHGPTD